MVIKLELKKLLERRAALEQELKQILDTADAEKRDLASDEKDRIKELKQEHETLSAKIEDLQLRSEARGLFSKDEDKPAPSTLVPQKRQVITRYDAGLAMRAFLTKGKEKLWRNDFAEAADRQGLQWRYETLTLNLHETRDQSVGTPSEGGYSVNGVIVSAFEQALKSYWSWEPYVTVHRTSGDFDFGILLSNDTSNTGGYFDELAQRTQTNYAFDRKVLKAYKIGSGVWPISNELISDSTIDILSVVGSALGERIGRTLSSEFTNGSGVGSNHITGFTLGSVNGATSFYKDGLDYGDLVDLYFSVEDSYRQSPKCVWQMHSSTLAFIVKMVDDVGRPVFQALSGGLNEAPRGTILGKPVVINDNLDPLIPDTTEEGTAVIYFGDFGKYHVRVVQDFTLSTSGEHLWDYDAVAVKGTVRCDGMLINAGTNPIKHLSTSMASGAPGYNDSQSS